jgi:biotin transporter BioY
MKYRVALVASRTLAPHGFAGWVYIALVALVHPVRSDGSLHILQGPPQGYLWRNVLRGITRQFLHL